MPRRSSASPIPAIGARISAWSALSPRSGRSHLAHGASRGENGCPSEFLSPIRDDIRQPKKRETGPFGADAAPDGAEKLLSVNVPHGLRRGLHDGATTVA